MEPALLVFLARAIEPDQRRSDVDNFANLGEQPLDTRRVGRRNLDHRLRGLHRQQRIVDRHGLAGLHAPFDDFGFLQSLAEVRELENLHHPSMTFRTASAIRATLGIYCISRRDSGTTTS